MPGLWVQLSSHMKSGHQAESGTENLHLSLPSQGFLSSETFSAWLGLHSQLSRDGLEMGLERVNNCLPDSPVQLCEMLLLPRGTKYNFALKVNSIRLTEGRKECSGSSFIQIPACCTSGGAQGSGH